MIQLSGSVTKLLMVARKRLRHKAHGSDFRTFGTLPDVHYTLREYTEWVSDLCGSPDAPHLLNEFNKELPSIYSIFQRTSEKSNVRWKSWTTFILRAECPSIRRY